MFGRATITLGIGPHSSSISLFCLMFDKTEWLLFSTSLMDRVIIPFVRSYSIQNTFELAEHNAVCHNFQWMKYTKQGQEVCEQPDNSGPVRAPGP